METGKLTQGRERIKTVLIRITAIAVFLAVSAFSEMGRSQEAALYGVLPVTVEAEEPPDLLKGFVFVPGAALLIGDHHVLALYNNPENGFYALALFSTECGLTGCTLGQLIAYSVVDGEGQAIKLANDVQVESDKVTQTPV
jgi:hypothetical protein